MKTKALKKEFIREIRKSKQRFLSIMLISMLGVAFFSGLRSCKTDMLLSADTFYDRTKMMDLRLLSIASYMDSKEEIPDSFLLTEEDVRAVSDCFRVEAAEGVRRKDALVKLQKNNLVVRLFSMTQNVNLYQLKEGRLPQRENECAVDFMFLSQSGYKIGDVVKLDTGDENPLTDSLKETEFTITGSVITGQFMSSARGSSLIGNGKVSSFLVLLPEAFSYESYDEIAVLLKNTIPFNSYEDTYQELVKGAEEEIIGISDQKAESMKADYLTELTELLDELTLQQDAFYAAKDKFPEIKKEIEDGFAAISDKREEIEKTRLDLNAEFEAAQEELDAYGKLLAQAKEEFLVRESEVKKAREEYDTYVEKLSAISQGPKDIERTLALKGIYLEDIIAAEEAIEAKRSEIIAMEEEYQNQVSDFKNKREESEKALSDGETELNQKEQELIQRKGELEEAELDYFENYDETKEKLADGISEVTKQIDNINQIEGKWITLNRDMIESYTGYRQDAERMDAIGKVFPAIFFLVAALVSLTTMTRMVDEERTQIGTLKALGYSKRQIASKYIKYAFYATLSGSVIGFLAGSKIFPYIVITTYKLVYAALPSVVIPVHWFYSALATVLAVCVTLLATLISIATSLKDTPATLMRPVAPKPGKRVLLEHIGILWNHLSFTRKASLRNMFRYKKRFFMTVIGIGGCMALLLVGFGIKDSICVMSELQYEKLCLYDLNAGIDASASKEEIEEFKTKIQEEKEVTDFEFCKEIAMEAQTEEGTKTLTLTVLPTEASFDSFYSFSDRVTGERYKLTENGAFITEKIARMLNVNVGDQIILKPTETKSVPVTVSGIVENYLFHYMYMTEKVYTEAFGESVEYSGCLMKLSVSGKEAEEAFAETLLTNYPLISGVTVTSTFQEKIDDMLKSLNVITYVLIVCAGMLAFIVLYNLSNINMNERKRELATLKVLGFYDREVSAYIYRENILLTILGIFAGVFLGKVLHAFIMQTVEVDLVMFGRIIHPLSYVYSICLTFIFAVLIGFFMHFRLKKIDMIESLKSVE